MLLKILLILSTNSVHAPNTANLDTFTLTAHKCTQLGNGAIDLSVEVGAPTVCVATGHPFPGNSRTGQGYLFDLLQDILDHAESMEIKVGIEFEPEILIECTDEVLGFSKRLDVTRWALISTLAMQPSTEKIRPRVCTGISPSS